MTYSRLHKFGPFATHVPWCVCILKCLPASKASNLPSGVPSCRATIGAADKGIVNDGLLEDVRKRVSERSGLTVAVDLQFGEADLGGGCIAVASGGRVRLENTVPRRLTEAKRRLKSLIVAEIEKNRE